MHVKHEVNKKRFLCRFLRTSFLHATVFITFLCVSKLPSEAFSLTEEGELRYSYFCPATFYNEILYFCPGAKKSIFYVAFSGAEKSIFRVGKAGAVKQMQVAIID